VPVNYKFWLASDGQISEAQMFGIDMSTPTSTGAIPM
jgi:hypothetical protein